MMLAMLWGSTKAADLLHDPRVLVGDPEDEVAVVLVP
jgi:hypothetical protein